MHALIPLLFALILINRRQLQHDNCYRVSVLSLVGLSYFVFLQYAMYVNRVFQDAGYALRYLPILGVVVAVVGLSFSPWMTRSSPWKAAILFVLFCAGTALSFGFDVSIKNKLAEFGGYFSDDAPPFSDLAWLDPAPILTEFPQISQRLPVPADWTVKQLATGHAYLYRELAGQKAAEIRPTCFEESNTDVPTFVENSLWSLEATGRHQKVECSRSDEQTSCLIQVRYEDRPQLSERWRWFRASAGASVHISVDVVLYLSTPDLKREVGLILKYAQPLDARPEIPCTTPSAWM